MEQSGGVLETPNLDTAKFGQKRRNLDFQPGRRGGRGLLCSGEICGEHFVLVLLTFHRQKKLPTSTANFTTALSKKIWSATANFVRGLGPECTKIARFSAAAAAIFTAPPKIARSFEAPRCAISSAKKIASEPRFLLRRKWVKMVLTAEFPATPSSAIKIASERRCAILVHSVWDTLTGKHENSDLTRALRGPNRWRCHDATCDPIRNAHTPKSRNAI